MRLSLHIYFYMSLNPKRNDYPRLLSLCLELLLISIYERLM